MTFRRSWILAGMIALALLSGTAAYPQATDADSSASRSVSAPAPAPTPVSAAPVHGRARGPVIDFYDLALGPLFVLAWGLFAAGFTWRIILFRRMTRPVHAAPVPLPARGAQAGEDFAFLTRGMSRSATIAFRFTRWVRRTVFPGHPVMGVMSLVFHIGLFLVPLLLPAHTIIFSRSAHVSLPSLPGPFMDKLTLVLLAIGGFFLLRRLFFPRVRALSTLRDYLVLLLVAAPLLTAYAAYHQWLNYRTMLVIHMLVGDTVIGAIPFTKLGHMPFLIYTRFFVSSEYSLRPGGRRW